VPGSCLQHCNARSKFAFASPSSLVELNSPWKLWCPLLVYLFRLLPLSGACPGQRVPIRICEPSRPSLFCCFADHEPPKGIVTLPSVNLHNFDTESPYAALPGSPHSVEAMMREASYRLACAPETLTQLARYGTVRHCRTPPQPQPQLLPLGRSSRLHPPQASGVLQRDRDNP